MGFKKKKKVANEGNTHAQKEPPSGTAESGKPRQNIQRLLKQLEDLTNENTKLRSEIAAKESSITALKKSLKDAKADAREAWNNLSECETKLERKADSYRHMKSRLHARAQVEEPDRVFSRAPATSTSEKAEATRKRNARMAEQVEALLQAEPVLLQSMLEDSPSSEHSTQLPVYIEILVAFLSRHRLAIPAALGILSNQKNTKLLLYLDKHANNNDVLCEIEHYFTQRAVNQIITNWTPTIGLSIRFRLGISEQKYGMLRQMLSKSFDRDSTTATTWYVLHKQSCDGTVKWQIKAPKLPSNYAVRSLRDEVAAKLDLKENELGTCAQVDFPTKLKQVIESEMNRGFLRTIVSTTPATEIINLELFVSGDAHGIHRGIKVTRVTFKLKVVGGVFNNSPFQMYTVVFFRGADNYANLIANTTDLTSQLATIAKSPLTVANNKFSFKLTHGGDLLFICASLAHYGVHGGQPSTTINSQAQSQAERNKYGNTSDTICTAYQYFRCGNVKAL
ncbi:hypothetical protein CYMTET_43003 [Cymbomonas tetramitiformis]|uniref:Uncharacterized protein n=1 Tax=Cymbomonas tetramitiformis TaxID=36881 RepID=A0AAE0C349_9CHLO|nr:hypothetical protein CYMTET_43003 [Cymbomonas tetramitiformis]